MFKIDQIITAYHKGFHKIVRIEKRTIENNKTNSPLIYYTQIMKENGDPGSGKLNACDAFYCKPIEYYIADEEKRLKKVKTLLSI